MPYLIKIQKYARTAEKAERKLERTVKSEDPPVIKISKLMQVASKGQMLNRKVNRVVLNEAPGWREANEGAQIARRGARINRDALLEIRKLQRENE